MRLGILNGKLGIAVIEGIEDISDLSMQEIENQLPEGRCLSDLSFFYMQDRDWIVLNKSHALYEYYLELISDYLKLSVENRKEAYNLAPTEEIKSALDLLDNILRHRFAIYGKAVI